MQMTRGTKQLWTKLHWRIFLDICGVTNNQVWSRCGDSTTKDLSILDSYIHKICQGYWNGTLRFDFKFGYTHETEFGKLFDWRFCVSLVDVKTWE